MTNHGEQQGDLLSDISDLDLVRHLLAEMHDDFFGRVMRLRQLTDLGRDLGRNGTMIFGLVAAVAWEEARSSFVNGNFVATVLLCQSLAEHLLASFLHGGLLVDDLPDRVAFKETLKRCQDKGLILERDARDLSKLMALRNPLSHFRHVNDESSVDRRSLDGREHFQTLLRRDAEFAIGLAIRILAKPQFRLG